MAAAAVAPPQQSSLYTGRIKVDVYTHHASPAMFIRVLGENIRLETFQARYFQRLEKLFGAVIPKKRQVVRDLTEIFCS